MPQKRIQFREQLNVHCSGFWSRYPPERFIFLVADQNVFVVACQNIFVAAGQNIFTLNLIVLALAVDLHAVHRKCLRSIDLAFQKLTQCKRNRKMGFSAFHILMMTLKFLAWFMVRIHYEGKHINRNSTHHSNQHQQMEQTKFWLVLAGPGNSVCVGKKKTEKKNKSQKQYKAGITSNRMNRNHVCVKLAEKQTNYLNLNWP